MKRIVFPSCLLVFFLIFLSLQSYRPFTSSAADEQQLVAKANAFNHEYPQEKIYLHLDRPSYWANEDIWFKAYLKNSPLSVGNLYVELLNARGGVVYRNICWVQNGLSYGDIHLADTLSSGMYQIRAYTNWLRNFDEQWFYRRDLVIWNLRDKAQTPETDELKLRDIDFRFFPEGGTFLSGADNRLAFKVTDRHGKGLEAEGVVTDGKGNEVAQIKSLYKGMGSLEITPKAGERYMAEVTVAGSIPMEVTLPVAAETGVMMHVSADYTASVRLEVSQNGMTNGKYLVVGQSGGQVYYHGEVEILSGKGTVTVDKSHFPTGIARLTLFDESRIPRCERLVFVNHHDQLDVKIEVEKTEYHPREKVILDLYTLTKEENPALANLSVSVYHTETTSQTEQWPENILTRFLLSSELKGLVEGPAYYFKDDSLSTQTALDNLMLTHGYRTFEWKEIAADKYPEIVYRPDTSIELRGKVTTIAIHRPVKNGKVTMMTVNTLLSVHQQQTDSLGRFLFSGLYFNDTIDVTLQAVNARGKRNTFVEVDRSLNMPPKASILPLVYQYKGEEENKTITYLSELSPELLNKKWHLSDTVLIGDINIMARKTKKDDGHMRPYKRPDYVFDISKVDDVYGNILESMEANSPAWRSFAVKDVHYFLNGMPVESDMILAEPASSFDKVEFVKTAPVPQGFGPAIFFYSKRGQQNKITVEAPGVTAVKLVGYSVIRHFYSPDYDNSEDQSDVKKDYRSTLYWNPVVETDEDGTAWVSFFNSDQTGEVQVVVEGVTREGKLCRGVAKYEVKH